MADPSAPVIVPVASDPVLELANLMISLGLAQEAARDLLAFIHEQHSTDPSHWFKALEIYRHTEQHRAFDETAQELNHTLNIAPPPWSPASEAPLPNQLEDYPHLIVKLQSLWGRPECEAFLNSLLEDNRQGQRSGFSRPVVEEIVLLGHLIKAFKPHTPPA